MRCPNQRAGRLFLAALAGCAGLSMACAHRPVARCTDTYRFPERFAATQVVRVEQQGEPIELLASLRREGGDFDLTFLDPVVQRPLVQITYTGGRFQATGAVPDQRMNVRALFDSVRQLYEAECLEQRGARIEYAGAHFAFDLSSLESWDGCGFPRVIRMLPRRRLAPAISVETVDLSCASDGSVH